MAIFIIYMVQCLRSLYCDTVNYTLLLFSYITGLGYYKTLKFGLTIATVL